MQRASSTLYSSTRAQSSTAAGFVSFFVDIDCFLSFLFLFF